MRPSTKGGLLVAALLLVSASAALAQTLDTIILGDSASETSHSLTTYFPTPSDTNRVPWEKEIPPPSDPSLTGPSEVTTGALGQSARRLLPRTPQGDVYGGQMTFSMKVDPVRQNYFTIKLWGADPNGGNLLLDCNGREIGGRHGTGGLSEDPLYFAGPGWFPGRFIYRTEPLPLSMTSGKSSVTITIRSLGGMFDYAPIFTYVPQYQHIMNSPSPSIYRAYTHTGTLVDVSSETQGVEPSLLTPRMLEDDESALLRVKQNVNGRLADLFAKSGADLSQGDAYFLAQCYDAKTNHGANWIEYPSGKTDVDLGNQIVAALDALVTKYAMKAAVATDGWGGALGDMGNAIRLSWPLLSDSMSIQINYGGSLGSVERKSAWSAALRASLDSGRFGRQTIANQALFNATNIYLANRGLLLVDPANALNESEARRYIKEACGLLPWLGNDAPGEGPVPTYGSSPYGPDWYMCTTKGTTKDGDGFVGSDYGETGSWVYKLGLWSGDEQILARGVTMTRARDNFRFPGPDDKGYLIMQGADPIGERNNDLPGHYVYLGRGFSDDFLTASQGPKAIGSDLLGYFQEGIEDGQMARSFADDPYLPGEYAAIKAMAATNIKLPMAIGHADFAWVDEENMVVAAKHGEERFFANLYWRQPGFINGLAKVFHLTPTIAHLGDVMVEDVRFRSTGQTKTTETGVDWFANPPDKPVAAFGGLQALVAFRSDLASVPPTNRDGGRGTGYTFHYGNWLVGINGASSSTYTVPLPSGVASATDLVSGEVKTGNVVLAPKTSVVFYLPNAATGTFPPSRTLYITAAPGNGGATVSWNPAGGAESYAVLRSTTSGGPYATIATGLTACSYTDKTATNGPSYYYVVVSANTAGASEYSPETSATPVAAETSTLTAPWGDTDIDCTGGSATVSKGNYSVTGGAGDIQGSSDNCHFLYQTAAGDGVYTAEIQNESSANANAKAGLMIRSSLDPKAAEATIVAPSPTHKARFIYRSADAGDSSNQTYGEALAEPYWVRLVRVGGNVTGYVSPDGKTWAPVATCTFANLPRVAYVGLTCTPGEYAAAQSNVANFDHVILPASANTLPLAPTSLQAVGGNTSATLTWAGDYCAGIFNVKRATSASGPFATIAQDVSDFSYTDYGLSNGSTYYYVVSSVNAAGKSADSPVASLHPMQLPSAVAGLSAKGASSQVTVAWTAQTGTISYIVRRASRISGPYTIVASELATPSFTDTGLKNGTLYYYQVSAVNGSGEGLPGAISALPPGGMPDEWQTIDIGQAPPGGAYWMDGKFTILGGGSDIWNGSDSFHFIYQPIQGDCRITARVTDMQPTAPGAKAGVMIRNSLDANSAFSAIYVTPGTGLSSQYRSAAGQNAAVQATNSALKAPYGLRIVRKGSLFSYYTSDDGATWTPLGTTTISMNDKIYIGLAVCSQNASTLNKASMDYVTARQDDASQ